jgi:hypothetical protein
MAYKLQQLPKLYYARISSLINAVDILKYFLFVGGGIYDALPIKLDTDYAGLTTII